jgi:PhnB protein
MTNAEFPGPTPQLTVADAAAAIRWYTEVFGADELVRTPGPGGRVLHCELLIFGGRLLLHDQFPELGVADPTPADLGGSPVMLHLYVPDVDALYATAIAAGAQGLMPPDDAFWGDRYAQLADPFGHRWSLGTQRDDPSADDLRERAAGWNANR